MHLLILLIWLKGGTGFKYIYKNPPYSPKYEIWVDKFKDLQDAINYLEQKDGGVIKLSPNEIYEIKNPPLVITKPYISIISNGNSTIEIKKDTIGINIKTSYIKLKGFTLKAPNKSSHSGIKIHNSRDIYMENIKVEGFGGSGIEADVIWGSTFIRTNINNCINGWNIKSGTSNSWINCYVNGIDSMGFNITSWYSSLINCSADHVDYIAYFLNKRVSNCAGVTMYNCGAEACDGILIKLEGTANGVVGFHALNSGNSLTNDAIFVINNQTSKCFLRDIYVYGPKSAYTFDFPAGSIRLNNIHPYTFDIDSAIFKSKDADIIWEYPDTL